MASHVGRSLPSRRRHPTKSPACPYPTDPLNRTDERAIETIAALRRLRFTGPEIAEVLDRLLSTVSGILTRIGVGKRAETKDSGISFSFSRPPIQMRLSARYTSTPTIWFAVGPLHA
jgi:hypothetical protein